MANRRFGRLEQGVSKRTTLTSAGHYGLCRKRHRLTEWLLVGSVATLVLVAILALFAGCAIVGYMLGQIFPSTFNAAMSCLNASV